LHIFFSLRAQRYEKSGENAKETLFFFLLTSEAVRLSHEHYSLEASQVSSEASELSLEASESLNAVYGVFFYRKPIIQTFNLKTFQTYFGLKK
jgi:hypothetical protein